MDISKRLFTVASAVTPGKRVADIGTDHGYVPIFLVQRGSCPSAIAMDINKGPLERAVEHIRQEGCTDKIGTRLSDGMMKLKADEADSVVIAGMGGDLICRILEARKDLLEGDLELVLQPQSEWFKLRHKLHEMGYAIEKEWFLKDEGKYYVVLKASKGFQRFHHEYEYEYGSFVEEECLPVLEEYLKKECEKREEIVKDILRRIEKEKEKKTEKNLCKKLQRIEELKMEIESIQGRLRAGR